MARCKNENNSNAASHRASVLDEFNVHPTGGGERGEKGTQRRRTAAAVAPRRNEGTLIDDNDDDDRKALKKGNTTRRQKLDASISLVLRLLRDSPSIRGLFVVLALNRPTSTCSLPRRSTLCTTTRTIAKGRSTINIGNDYRLLFRDWNMKCRMRR